MKRFRLLVLLVVMGGLGLSQLSQAQTVFKGTVSDSLSRNPLQGATIRIADQADSVIHSVTTDQLGKFTSVLSISGDFVAHIYFLGYEHQLAPLSIRQGQKELVMDIRMVAESIQLEGVDIIVNRDVQLKGDTTEFNASAFKTEPYADSDELIAQLPGVEIDAEGNVIAQGEQVTRILVDGKEFFSTDPRIAMKNLPADIIDKIQLIDEKSEQSRFTGFDDGVRNKVINIVTKPNRRNGYYGRGGSALGSLDRYNMGGNVNFFDGDRRLSIMAVTNNVNQQNFGMADIGVEDGQRDGRSRGNGGQNQRSVPGNSSTTNLALNYNNSWLEEALKVSGDYSFNTTSSIVQSFTNRETLIGNNANQLQIENSNRDRNNRNHRAGMRINLTLDSVHEFTFRPGFNFQQTHGVNVSNSYTTSKENELINQSNRNQENRSTNMGFSGSLDYRLRLGKQGRTLSLNTSANLNSNRGLAQTLSMNEYFEDFVLGRVDTSNRQNNTEGLGNGINGRVTYTEPISTGNRLAVNYGVRDNSNYSNRETLDFLAETGQFSELNRQLSNRFNNDYLHHSGGLSYQYSKQSFNADIGLDYQGSAIKNQRSFPSEEQLSHRFESYLPNASISYRPSRALNLRLRYETSTNAPSINQLQDVINNENPLNIRTGNSDLDQEFQHRFNLSVNRVNRESGRNLNVSLNADFSNNRVVNSTYIAKADTLIAPGILLGKGGQFTQPVNVNGYYTMRGNVSWGSPIKALKLNLNLTTGLHHNHNIGLMNNQETYSDTYGINQRISINSRISEKLLFNVAYSGNYSIVNSSLNGTDHYNYFNQTLRSDLTWIFWKGIRINSSMTYNKNIGLSQDYDQSFMLLNASVGKKLFKKQQAELTLSAYDLLNENITINRTVNERYIMDSSTNTLRQYFMLGFTYNLRHFGGGDRRGG